MATKDNSEKMYEITFQKDRSKDKSPHGFYVAVNGVGMFIPRDGKPHEVPERFYEAIMNQANHRDASDEFIAKEIRKSKTDMNA